MAETYKAACFCGGVEMEVTGTPAFQGYCHCTDCRGWLGAPVHAATLWAKDGVRVTKGADNLILYKKTEGSHRQSCKTCGGAIKVDHPTMGLVDVPAAVIAGYPFKPVMHIFYGEKMISMKDGLPKFAKMPKEFGGSGEMLAE
ncbi:MAG: GFA family protein [Alphaproteobacteria bacterium]|nr:GFA family protein [Alphaproteobacteria bacterium]